MTHLDLFSGIGGFALAVDTVWPNSEHIFCDNDKFCQQVLRKHWPNSYIYDDIRAIANAQSGQSGEQNEWQGWKNFSRGSCDILTGGFPCQPFSQAGKRKGTNDDRYLWPEMLRVIREVKPTWVIVENVRGLLTMSGGLVFEQVCVDLENAGYEVQPFIIPAVAVNAPHRRDRVWFVACNANSIRRTIKTEINSAKVGEQTLNNFEGRYCNARYPISIDAQGLRNEQYGEKQNRLSNRESTGWEQNWLEVATEFCRVDDGLPEGLDFTGWSKARHRVERLKSLGNAIVPQVAIEIMQAIATSLNN